VLAATAAVGHPTATRDVFALAATGGGILVVAGQSAGMAFAGDVWTPFELSPRPDWVVTLPDGTIAATSIGNGRVFLGTRAAREIQWVEVVLEQG
jgi:hypothetical protein